MSVNLFQGKSLENLGTPGKTKDSKSNKHVCVLSRFSRVQLLATPWMVTCQGPPSMGFFRQNTGVGCHSLLQGIFPTQRSNPGLLHSRQILYQLSYQMSFFLEDAPAPGCVCVCGWVPLHSHDAPKLYPRDTPGYRAWSWHHGHAHRGAEIPMQLQRICSQDCISLFSPLRLPCPILRTQTVLEKMC